MTAKPSGPQDHLMPPATYRGCAEMYRASQWPSVSRPYGGPKAQQFVTDARVPVFCACACECIRRIRVVLQTTLVLCPDVLLFADAVRLTDSEHTHTKPKPWACYIDRSVSKLGDRGQQFLETLGHSTQTRKPKKSRKALNA